MRSKMHVNITPSIQVFIRYECPADQQQHVLSILGVVIGDFRRKLALSGLFPESHQWTPQFSALGGKVGRKFYSRFVRPEKVAGRDIDASTGEVT